ncbi:hypothetical protein ROZALSC1DRAFT_30369 [Rozella allomycis CSF55]|uniref:Ran-binding and NUP50 nuclear pore complex domain-containing protein n=1 Tax=Rozella allomycis (strain CSF55) TaxID=988480 RepID=A0A075AXL0_ROZAC|nr:Ran-binding and NUP50 nuclear pore complex domain-containing protein [Rozella allomycis CSF55]RKP17876.1 hypothetical protein ROZALSC1DRAFT_30369 [Rozella allomycis CSF55]|eukprot:EPZ34884.1 Ran-binding and NUP50 nuclear pore complex domain-containing protein [Rozella allomycis CSF55]
MSKRGANQQITQLNFDHEDEDVQDEGSWKRADESILSTRQISKPKRRLVNKEKSAVNPFASLANFGSKPKPEQEKKTEENTSKENFAVKDNREKEFHASIKGLNMSFTTKIGNEIKTNPFIDLSKFFDSYKNHYSTILQKYPDVKNKLSNPGKGENTVKLNDNKNGQLESKVVLEEVKNVGFKIGEEKPIESKFTFGQTSATESKDLPKFTFGQTTITESKEPPKFSFGSASSIETKEPPKFTFGQPATTESKEPLKFTFGQAASTTGSKEPIKSNGFKIESNFSLSNSTQEDIKPTNKFAFGKTEVFESSSKDVSEKKELTTEKSQFSFGNPINDVTSTKPTDKPFLFGSSNSTPQLSFSFGTNNNSSSGFTFGAKVDKKEENDDEIPQGEEESFLNKRSNDELIKTGEGEENEEVLCESRSKIFQLKENNEWSDLGVGIFKVNRNKETQKSRALFRSEGSGKVLFNYYLPSFICSYNQGKKEIHIALFTGDTKPTKYFVRFKEPSVANLFYETVDKNKSK